MKPLHEVQLSASQETKKELTNYLQSTDTLPHLINGQYLQISIPDWINEKFNDAYPSWNKKELPSTWIQAISVLSIPQIRKAVNYFLTERELSNLNTDFPPSIRQFIAAGQDSGVDYQAAYLRFIEKKPKTRPEQWVYENYSFNLRRMSSDQSERSHKKYLQQAIDMEKAGQLKLNAEILAKALPGKIERNMNDIAIQEYQESGKTHKFAARIENLRRTKRPTVDNK